MDHNYLRRSYLELGLKFCKAGNWDQSAQMLEAGRNECERLGFQDMLTAAILCNLAVVYQRQGRSNEIEALLLKGMFITKKFYAETHASVVTVSRLLADHYYDQKLLSEARPLYKRVLAATSMKKEERINCLIRLAAIENANQRRSTAEALCREVCELRYGKAI